jgi:hypothetical protein
MNSLTPIQKAAFEARIAERAMHLFAEGYRAEMIDDTTFFVTNEEGTRYEIDTLFETCSCPCYKHRDMCKHLFGLKGLLADQAAYEEAQVANLEADYEGLEDREDLFSTNYGGALW